MLRSVRQGPDVAPTADLSWLVPNGCDNAHDCSIQTFDTWLRDAIGPLLLSPYFRPGGTGLLIIVFDENADNGNPNCDTTTEGQGCGGQVELVVVSPLQQERIPVARRRQPQLQQQLRRRRHPAPDSARDSACLRPILAGPPMACPWPISSPPTTSTEAWCPRFGLLWPNLGSR